MEFQCLMKQSGLTSGKTSPSYGDMKTIYIYIHIQAIYIPRYTYTSANSGLRWIFRTSIYITISRITIETHAIILNIDDAKLTILLSSKIIALNQKITKNYCKFQPYKSIQISIETQNKKKLISYSILNR